MAADVDATADRVRAGAGIEWTGVAAERHRERLADHGRQVASARDELLQLAGSLEHLADTLVERQAAIRRATQLVEDAVDGARRTLGRLAGVAEDALTDAERATKRAADGVLDVARRGLPLPGAPEWSGLAKTIGDLW